MLIQMLQFVLGLLIGAASATYFFMEGTLDFTKLTAAFVQLSTDIQAYIAQVAAQNAAAQPTIDGLTSQLIALDATVAALLPPPASPSPNAGTSTTTPPAGTASAAEVATDNANLPPHLQK